MNEELCKGCMLCVAFCPKKIILRSEKLNKYGSFVPKITKPENCIECRNCELYCPEFAVSVEK
ncbi:MAG: 4Fe-4S binding protein [Candidatus Thermoplasmatota archaeon]|nr:4Fe-4S binding protein [Candidatus Thermoplasmatota archaeon]